MNQLVTPSFLFRWSFPAVRIDSLPNASGRLLDLPVACRLPSVSELDSGRDFADVRVAWNEGGLAISVDLRGRTKKPTYSAATSRATSGIMIWIDTRNTQGVHRATRFCHQFFLSPSGGGRKHLDPVADQIPLARAREEMAPPNLSSVRIHSEIDDDGYRLEAWLPAEIFIGFDPAASSRLGFHYLVHDDELGEQSLAVGSEFPVASDPSLWQTLELVS